METTLDVAADGLAANFNFFLPWAGIEKTELENLNFADIKAAEKMAKLYDEIVRTPGNLEGDDATHDLNVFFSRLLFCFFAEDTGVFEPGSFTNAIGSSTRESGEDANAFLDELFAVLDTEPDDRDGVAEHLRRFRLREREPVLASEPGSDAVGQGESADSRLRNARLVGDQPRHLRLDDAGGRSPR